MPNPSPSRGRNQRNAPKPARLPVPQQIERAKAKSKAPEPESKPPAKQAHVPVRRHTKSSSKPAVLAVSSSSQPIVTYDSHYRWQLGPRELRYYWLVDLNHVLTGIECIFRRYKPAHTDVVFTYRSKLDRAISLYPWLGV